MNGFQVVDPSEYFVRRDSGPAFHPLNVRLQGDDPITVGILLDVRSDTRAMPQIASAIAALAPGSLHPSDHLSVFALDCDLVRSLQNVSANPQELQAAVDNSLIPALEALKAKHSERCAKRTGLWDALGFVVNDLGHLPGRRVLFAVTDGNDHGSAIKSNELLNFAEIYGIAVFGFNPGLGAGHQFSLDENAGGGSTYSSFPAGYFKSASQQHFNDICVHSGGMVLQINTKNESKTAPLATFIARVRERYILDLPSIPNGSTGKHTITITIPSLPPSYVRPTGVVAYMPSPGNVGPSD